MRNYYKPKLAASGILERSTVNIKSRLRPKKEFRREFGFHKENKYRMQPMIDELASVLGKRSRDDAAKERAPKKKKVSVKREIDLADLFDPKRKRKQLVKKPDGASLKKSTLPKKHQTSEMPAPKKKEFGFPTSPAHLIYSEPNLPQPSSAWCWLGTLGAGCSRFSPSCAFLLS